MTQIFQNTKIGRMSYVVAVLDGALTESMGAFKTSHSILEEKLNE